jgi:hypothetical protein
MRFIACSSLLLVMLSAGVSNAAYGQSNACLSQADSSRAYLTMVRDYYRWTDSTPTVAGGDPWAPAALVQQVNDSTVCNSVVGAFNQVATGTAAQETSGYVFAIGSAGYAFVRPGDTTDGRRTFYIFLQNMSYRGSVVQ